MRILFVLMAVTLSSASALAQSPASKDAPRGTWQEALQDDIPLDSYMAALGQISPAARDGADAYRQAFMRRCGRALKTIELRLAIANGSGDPVLMAMMRAASQRDTTALQRLSDTISCSDRR